VRVWCYPVVPLLFVVAALIILGNALREHPGATGLAFGGILLGVPVYYGLIRRPAQNEYRSDS
jgi:APA family basic amino acid/polyamine antiporter